MTTFQSTLPMRGATVVWDRKLFSFYDFNPRSPCGERRLSPAQAPEDGEISIHAPHAGSDMLRRQVLQILFAFQSTLPMRGATSNETINEAVDAEFQSTLPMRGATSQSRPSLTAEGFQSTLPMRGATGVLYRCWQSQRISIHAPHAGSDAAKPARGRIKPVYFNPRSPCGERRQRRRGRARVSDISIHAPHAGSDTLFALYVSDLVNFNPRSPCGERPNAAQRTLFVFHISIHAPHAGSDGK